MGINPDATHSHTTGAPSGLFTGLAPGTYTHYLAIEDDGVPLLELHTHTFTIEEAAAPPDEVVVVDDNGNSSTASSQLSVSLTTAQTGEDNDAAILVIATQLSGYDLAVTFNSVTVPRIQLYASGAVQIFLLEEPPIGTHTLQVTEPNEFEEDLTFIAVSVRKYAGYRESLRYAANATSPGPSSCEVGDLLIAWGFRAGATNLTIGSPWDRIDFRGGSGRFSTALATAIADSTSSPSGTWTATGGSGGVSSGGIALIPTVAPPPEEEPPDGTVSFDAAVGSDRIVLRNVEYSGEDTGTTGFKLQYQIGSGTITDYVPREVIDGFTEGEIITVRMRAVNNEGDGEWAAYQSFRIHYDWHNHGVKRWWPSTAVGHNSAGWDQKEWTTATGLLTTGGDDRLIVAANDVAYGTPGAVEGSGTNPTTTAHAWTYDSTPLDRIAYLPEQDESVGGDLRMLGTGGAEMHIQVNPTVGQNALGITHSGAERSVWIAACSLYNAHQSAPVGGLNGGIYSTEHVPDQPPPPPDRLILLGQSQGLELELAGGPLCSRDEAVVVLYGSYAFAPENSYDELLPNNHNLPKKGEGGSISPQAWSPGNDAGTTPEDINGLRPLKLDTPVGAEWIAGCGGGAEDGIALYWFPDSLEPGAEIIGTWGYVYASIIALAVRPSPNMLHTLAVGERTETDVAWTCQSDVNHGRVLIALTLASDPAPTAQQIRDEIDETSEDDPYSGDFLATDTLDLTAAGSNGDTLAATITPETEYRLSVVYESWQWNLGAPLAQTFSLVADPPIISDILTYPNAVFPIHDGGATTEARIDEGEPVLIGADGGIGGLTAGTMYDDPGLQLREFGGEWGEGVPFTTRAASAPIVIRQSPPPPVDLGLYETFEFAVVNEAISSNQFTTFGTATFSQGETEIVVDMFFDGDQTWRCRFMPKAEGEWTYAWTLGAMSGGGEIQVGPAAEGNHGHVTKVGQYLWHDDGTAHVYRGANWFMTHSIRPSSDAGTSVDEAPYYSPENLAAYLDRLNETGHNGAWLNHLDVAMNNDRVSWSLPHLARIDEFVQGCAARGMTCVLGTFNTWGRNSSNRYTISTSSGDQLLDPWNSSQAAAQEYFLRYLIARYSGYPVWLELVNEGEHSNSGSSFNSRANSLYVPVINDRWPYDEVPLTASENDIWGGVSGVNVVGYHQSNSINLGSISGKAAMHSEIVSWTGSGGDGWQTDAYADAENRSHYRRVWWIGYMQGGSGCVEATVMFYAGQSEIETPAEFLADTNIQNVMEDHGRFGDFLALLESEAHDITPQSIGSSSASLVGRRNDTEAAGYLYGDLSAGQSVTLSLPTGSWAITWFDPVTGDTESGGTVAHNATINQPFGAQFDAAFIARAA